MNNLIGKIISGRYRIEAFLGKGGMAEVYKVWDQERSVHLAMKILHADLAEDKVFLRRFKREAQTLAELQHPNIVRFYGLEQDGNLVFMLMDYVDGITLRTEIFQAKEPFTLKRIIEVMKPVCAALHFAHKAGFVHCDVKPANIMIHSNGAVLISDFGIARMTEAATVTMVGAGTPAYMAPEQARGKDPVPQTDIYALGIILFEMLTGGERPFTGESAKTTGSTSEKVRWEQIRLAAPPPSKYNPSISKDIDEIVLKCLDKTPSGRYLSATDLLSDLVRQIVKTEPPLQSVIPAAQLEKSEPVLLPKESREKKVQKANPEQPARKQSTGRKKPIDKPRIEPRMVPRSNQRRGCFVGLSMIAAVAILIGFDMFYGDSSFTKLFAVATPTRTPRPTPTRTHRPAATTTPSCYRWNEINEKLLGKEVCVFGAVYVQRIMPYGGSRIFFDSNQAFFLVSSDYWFPDVKKGECVKGYGKVELSAEKLLYINIKDALSFCD